MDSIFRTPRTWIFTRFELCEMFNPFFDIQNPPFCPSSPHTPAWFSSWLLTHIFWCCFRNLGIKQSRTFLIDRMETAISRVTPQNLNRNDQLWASKQNCNDRYKLNMTMSRCRRVGGGRLTKQIVKPRKNATFTQSESWGVVGIPFIEHKKVSKCHSFKISKFQNFKASTLQRFN